MKIMRRWLCICLCLCLLFGGCARGAFDEADRVERTIAADTGTKSGRLLQNTDWFPAGSSAADWFALTLYRCGVREDYDGYLRDLRAFAARPDADLSATDCARIALTVQTLGGDPRAFGGVDLLAAGFARYDDGAALNAAIYLLLAMDACGYADDDVRGKLRETIAAAQETDGGFGLTRGSSDTDVTAMALQSLAPYREDYAAAIGKALDYLAGTVTAAGACTSMGDANVESTAQVLLALCALGIDPRSDARFAAVPDGLLRFRLQNGMYLHRLSDSQYDLLATQQALLARCAFQNMQ